MHQSMNAERNAHYHSILNQVVHGNETDERTRRPCTFHLIVEPGHAVHVWERYKPVMAAMNAFFDVYIRMLCCLLDLRKLSQNYMVIPKTGGRFLITGLQCVGQVGHNDNDHRKGKGAGFFIIVTGADGASLCMSDSSHKHVHLPEKKMMMIASAMRLTCIVIKLHSVFIGRGYVPHARVQWSSGHKLCCQMY